MRPIVRPLPFALLLLLGGAAPRPRPAEPLPPIVFVSRTAPAGADAAQIPGLGPRGSRIVTGGRLMLRERGGALRELLPSDVLSDVQDPDVSPDATRLVFSGRAAADSGWRVWVMDLDGRGLRALTGAARTAGGEPADDVDPCWLGDRIVFASTRDAEPGPYDGRPETNLWCVPAAGGSAQRLTYEHGGALDPFADGAARLGYSRWWFNPWRPARAGGLTRDAALAASPDTVNQWQAVSRAAAPGGVLGDPRLAAGGAPDRRAGMALQAARLADGSIVATYAGNTGLAPAPAGTGIQRFAARGAPGSRLAGLTAVSGERVAYERATGLAPPNACAPAALPGGGVVFAMDRGGRGDFGLWRLAPGASRPEPVADLPGTLELDPAPVVRRAPAAFAPRAVDDGAAPKGTFTYANADVFAGRGAPARTAGARLRVYEPRPRSGGRDTLALLRDVPVPVSGHVEIRGLPADTPLFEQLVGPRGEQFAGASGPALVRGFNIGAPGGTSSCRGCHLGHSARP